MSLTVPTQKRIWLPIAAGALMLSIIATASLSTLVSRQGTPSDPPEAALVPSVLDQAPWKIKIIVGGALGGPTKKERARVEAQRKPLRQLVREIYTAMILARGELKEVVDRRFSPHAAAALRKSDAGLPDGTTSVETTTREARVSVDAAGAHQAGATVNVKFTAVVKGQELRIGHRATLWMERTGRHWKVIAFDVKQGRLATHKSTGRNKHRKGSS
ncbi:MAG: hypothetical protein ACRDJI_09405 [Actinomycetota bacterium]